MSVRIGGSVAAVLVLVALAAIAVIAVMANPPVDSLAQRTWQWIGTRSAGEATAPGVPDPASYTIVFRSGGSFVATADCAQVSGRYRVLPPGRMGPGWGLRIAPDQTALGCGPGSLADDFLEDLAGAARYAVKADVLTIELADGGAMTFR